MESQSKRSQAHAGHYPRKCGCILYYHFIAFFYFGSKRSIVQQLFFFFADGASWNEAQQPSRPKTTMIFMIFTVLAATMLQCHSQVQLWGQLATSTTHHNSALNTQNEQRTLQTFQSPGIKRSSVFDPRCFVVFLKSNPCLNAQVFKCSKSCHQLKSSTGKRCRKQVQEGYKRAGKSRTTRRQARFFFSKLANTQRLAVRTNPFFSFWCEKKTGVGCQTPQKMQSIFKIFHKFSRRGFSKTAFSQTKQLQQRRSN